MVNRLPDDAAGGHDRSLGLLMIVYHPPGWERFGGWLFGLAFLVALGFGAWLMWSIWRSGR
jgi:hypothetical protein